MTQKAPLIWPWTRLFVNLIVHVVAIFFCLFSLPEVLVNNNKIDKKEPNMFVLKRDAEELTTQ